MTVDVDSPPTSGGMVKPSQSFSTSCQVSKGFTSQTSTPLPADYILTDDDVLCGRGSRCFNHTGNQRFRKLVESHLHRYTNTMCKYDKSAIICEIVNEIRQNSPNGGFVKFDSDANRYFEVGDFLAREKTSQAFRDALQDKYKSSNSTKRKKRMVESQNKLSMSNSNLNSSSHHSHDGNTFFTMNPNASWRSVGGDESLNNSFHFDMDGSNHQHNPYKNLNNAEDNELTMRQLELQFHTSLPNLATGFGSTGNMLTGGSGMMRNNISNVRGNALFPLQQNNNNNNIGLSSLLLSRSAANFNCNVTTGRNSSLTNLQRYSTGDNEGMSTGMRQQGNHLWNNGNGLLNSSTSNIPTQHSGSALSGSNRGNGIRDNMFLNAMGANSSVSSSINHYQQQQRQQQQHQHEQYSEETTLKTEPNSDQSSVASFEHHELMEKQQQQQQQQQQVSSRTSDACLSNNMIAWGTQSCPDMNFGLTTRGSPSFGSGNKQFSTLPLCLENNEERDGSFSSPQQRSGRFLACGRQNELLARISCNKSTGACNDSPSGQRQPSASDLLGSLPIENGNTLVSGVEQDRFSLLTRFQQQQQQQQPYQQQQHNGLGWANQSCPSFGRGTSPVQMTYASTLDQLDAYFDNDDWEEITSPSCVFASPSGKPRRVVNIPTGSVAKQNAFLDCTERETTREMVLDDSNNGDFDPMPLDLIAGSKESIDSDLQAEFLSSIQRLPSESSSLRV